MSDVKETMDTQATALCKSCGLCCSGHLFAWVKLRVPELDSARALGLHVLGSDPAHRGFNQPCPLWNGECTIYTSPHYPHACRTYKCKLLKNLLDENIALRESLGLVEQAKEMIHELESFLPASPNSNFRERLVARMEQLEKSTQAGTPDPEFLQKARTLLLFYERCFGVKDIVNDAEEV